jgi:hypothetical protein
MKNAGPSQPENTSRYWRTKLAIILILLGLAYPVSAGPVFVVALEINTGRSLNTFETVYRPVFIAAESIGLGDAVQTYMTNCCEYWYRFKEGS